MELEIGWKNLSPVLSLLPYLTPSLITQRPRRKDTLTDNGSGGGRSSQPGGGGSAQEGGGGVRARHAPAVKAGGDGVAAGVGDGDRAGWISSYKFYAANSFWSSVLTI